MSTLELPGLKGHHPLGFLAACGTLVVVNQSEENQGSALHWRPKAEGWEPCLTSHCSDQENLIKHIRQDAQSASAHDAWKWMDKIKDAGKFREKATKAIEQRERRTADDFAAQATHLLQKNGNLQSTFFDLTSGNQQLLKSVRDLAASLSDDAVCEALIGPWRYQDDAHSLGWDPQSQRLHALRHKLPEQDKANRSVRAAVFLASQALPLFPCFAVGGKLRTTGFHRENEEDWFTWPIWKQLVSLDTLRTLLAHPLTPDLKKRGVEMLYRCRRVRTGGAEGNYQIFSNAEECSWS